MLSNIIPLAFPFSSRSQRPRYEADIRVSFPPVEELINRAQRTTESCIHIEQLLVSRDFFKSVAARGFYHKRYTQDDAKKVGIIVDYIAQARARELSTADAI